MFLLVLAGGVISLWWTSSRAKELAIGHARRVCENASLQLLDQTVSIKRMRSARNQHGNFCLTRTYTFEFTQAGEYRDQGTVSMRGYQLEEVYLPFVRDDEGNRIFHH